MSRQPAQLDPEVRFGADFVALCRDAARVRRYQRVMLYSGFGVVWLVAMLFAVVTAWRAYANYHDDKILRSGGRVTGRVLDVRSGESIATGRDTPELRYTYNVAGVDYERTREVSGRVASMYQTGSPIQVLYNRATPGTSLPAATDPAGPAALFMLLVPVGLFAGLTVYIRQRVQIAAYQRAVRQIVRVQIVRGGQVPLRSIAEVVGALSPVSPKRRGVLSDAFFSTADVLARAGGVDDDNVLRWLEHTARDSDVGHVLEHVDYANRVILLDDEAPLALPQAPPHTMELDPQSANSAEATMAFLVAQHRQLNATTYLRVAADRIDRPTASRHLAATARAVLARNEARARDLYGATGTPGDRVRTQSIANAHVRAHGLEPSATGLVPTHIEPDPAPPENTDFTDETRALRPAPEMLLFVQRALYTAYLQPWDWRRGHGTTLRARTRGDQTCALHIGFDDDLLFEIRVAQN